MTGTIAQLRADLAGAVGTVSGLRTAAIVPDQLNPPLAVVYRKVLTYAQDLDGATNYNFGVSVYVSRTDDRASQAFLDTLCEPSGPSSIKQAVETDPTLGAACNHFVTVMSVTPVQVATVGAVEYLMVDFTIELVG